MMYTKELISGKDIDLRKYNLGIIRQPKVDDFMSELDMIDFLKPFYLVRSWDVNGIFKDNEIPFTFFLVVSKENIKILETLMIGLKLLYDTDGVNLIDVGADGHKIIIQKDNKPFAFIDDSNFNHLCKVILKILYYDEPVEEKEDDIQGEEEAVRLVKQIEKEYEEKQKGKNTIHFEEIVRRLIHMRKCNYEHIKNLTIWQLQDTYKSYLFMDNEMLNWQFASSGNFKIKQIKKWQDETKIVRDAQN